MRALVWLIFLFVLATLLALLAGSNQAAVTFYLSPTRAVDMSMNMAILLVVGLFLFGHGALRLFSGLYRLPRHARRWRIQQRERAMHGHLLDALSYYLSGRFSRARQAAEKALLQEEALHGDSDEARELAREGRQLPYGQQLRALAHYLLAESSQAMQDGNERDRHETLALAAAGQVQGDAANDVREGIQLRGIRWALEDRHSDLAMQRLKSLPQGAARRVVALRYKLKAARQQGETGTALETARTLARHKAFTPQASRVLLGRLISDRLQTAFDMEQLEQAWRQLDPAERSWPEVATQAAHQVLRLGGQQARAREWLLPVWQQFATQPNTLSAPQRQALLLAIEGSLQDCDGSWLQRIETAWQQHPARADLQYLMGMACMQRQLWGKAQQLLGQAVRGLQSEPELRRNSWRAMAVLAEQRGDAAAAAEAWKQAALV